MIALIVDPKTYDKAQGFKDATTQCSAFLALNAIALPRFHDDTPPDEGKWKNYGLYITGPRGAPGDLFVNVKRSRPPTGVPGFSWTFPGFKSDLTAVGITAHECGHHVQAMLGVKNSRVKAAFSSEPAVSGYEPHPGESMAEAMRLFIINPLLLGEGRPKRWRFITKDLGLVPIHGEPWRAVLQHAHPRFIAAAEKWIERGEE